jgi:hypothetical protein
MDVIDFLGLARGPLERVYATLVTTLLSLAGSPFTSEPFRYDTVRPIGSVLQTPRFVLVFEGLDISGGGGGYFTVAGSHGIFPRIWGGYTQGEHAHTEQRILPDGTVSPQTVRRVFRYGYDPVHGMAKLDFYGRQVTIEEDGRKLRIGDKLLDIPAGQRLDDDEAAFDGNRKLWHLPGPRPVIFVDQGGRVRTGNADDVTKLRSQTEQNPSLR